MKAAALRGALSDRAREGRVHVVSSLVDGDVPSTKSAITLLTSLTERSGLLVVIERTDEIGLKSVRNVRGVHTLSPDQLNTYDVLVSDDVVFTQGALDEFLERAGGSALTVGESSSSAAADTGDDDASESGTSDDTVVSAGDVTVDEAIGESGTADEDEESDK